MGDWLGGIKRGLGFGDADEAKKLQAELAKAADEEAQFKAEVGAAAAPA